MAEGTGTRSSQGSTQATSMRPPRPNTLEPGSVLPSFQVDHTWLAAACGHCSGGKHGRTPLYDVSNQSLSLSRQKSPGPSRKFCLDSGRVFSDENNHFSCRSTTKSGTPKKSSFKRKGRFPADEVNEKLAFGNSLCCVA
ncbi:hypothetical protein DCAR_0313588 [Daucus carota subsp. sativus]|uniref:Uncharacterized protein n=1 Tax=Daucus carota subsp. sativus TaxID=79200 RepID=A0A166C401_DAUCS|nr:hypothetical protein DCAR_0313588 [Daucus carota subsp. sativus]